MYVHIALIEVVFKILGCLLFTVVEREAKRLKEKKRKIKFTKGEVTVVPYADIDVISEGNVCVVMSLVHYVCCYVVDL